MYQARSIINSTLLKIKGAFNQRAYAQYIHPLVQAYEEELDGETSLAKQAQAKTVRAWLMREADAMGDKRLSGQEIKNLIASAPWDA